MHMVRNSVDHGIEAAASAGGRRQAAGGGPRWPRTTRAATS